MCSGSYGHAKPDTTRHGKRMVTGECPACGKRVAFVTLHALPLRPRGLGRHNPPAAK
jgi:hypothetical protein